MSRFTHYCSDPDHPERAMAFAAYKCTGCGKLHRVASQEPEAMPWILANWAEKLVQISDIPPTYDEAHGILEKPIQQESADESTQAKGT
jgi:hypothetical protein